MILFSKIKHFVLLSGVLSMIGILAFTLEKSEFTDFTNIEIQGNYYLSVEKYLSFAKLNDLEGQKINAAIIRDRLSKHPYIQNIDVIREERGLFKIHVFEKEVDAVLLQKGSQYLITNKAEILPFIYSTKNLDLPVIILNSNVEKAEAFQNAGHSEKIYSALKIISTAEIYDPLLHQSISEINLFDDNISLQLMGFTSPIYFGVNSEIEKTVYLSKIFNHMKLNKLDEYLKYVDLRFTELVYLGFDEQITNDEENI